MWGDAPALTGTGERTRRVMPRHIDFLSAGRADALGGRCLRRTQCKVEICGHRERCEGVPLSSSGWEELQTKIGKTSRHNAGLVRVQSGLLRAPFERDLDAVSKVLLKHVRDLPAGEAERLRRTRAAYLASMYQMAIQLYEQGQSDRGLPNVLGMMLDLMEREAKLLASTRKRGTTRNRRLTGATCSQRSGTFSHKHCRLTWKHLSAFRNSIRSGIPSTQKALTTPVLLTTSVTPKMGRGRNRLSE